MSALTIPNTINNGDALDATKVMGNFAAISSWANSNLLRADGGVAMTGQLTLVGDPVNASHAARKAYVDARFASVGLPDSGVTTIKLADGAVTTAKLDQTAGTQAVATATIRDFAVTSAKLAVNAVTTEKIAAGAVTGVQLAPATITSDKLAPAALQGVALADGSVTTAKLDTGAVTSEKIADGTIATADLANGAITNLKIADNTILNAKIYQNTLDWTKMKRPGRAVFENTTSQSIASGATVDIVFQSNLEDTFDGGVSYGSGNKRIFIPASYATNPDMAVVLRLSFTGNSPSAGFGSYVSINTGIRDYNFLLSPLAAQTYSAVLGYQTSAIQQIAQITNLTGATLTLSAARFEMRHFK